MTNIEIKKYTNYDNDEIVDLYKSVGWINYANNPIMLMNAYQNSLYIAAAYVDGNLAGIIRVIGDGHSIIYIQDIIVSPEYQRLGLGTKMIMKVLNKFENTYQIVLITDNTDKTTKFYESIGFDSLEKLSMKGFIIM